MIVNEHRVNQLLDEARYYEDHAMWLHAVQVFQRLIDAFPERLEFRARLGNVYLEMGNLAAAELVLLQALRNDAQNPDILYSLGIACYQSGDFERALFYMQQLAGRKLPKVHYSLGLIFWQQGELAHAERHFRLALEYQPDNIDTALALGETLLRAGKAEDAVTVLATAAARAPRDGGLQHTLGVARVAAEQWDEAVLAFRTAIGLDPANEEARIAVAGAYMKLRRFDDAEAGLKEVLRNNTSSVRAMLALGKLALLKSNRKRAEEYFRQVLTIDPDNEDALEQLRYFTPHDTSAS
ncbi:MAG: tetratricopeptide repeat protein, partial [Bacteroidota bacterium]|nr:tetratricopeptide repeat protein [Bacteroidota bacterium]